MTTQQLHSISSFYAEGQLELSCIISLEISNIYCTIHTILAVSKFNLQQVLTQRWHARNSFSFPLIKTYNVSRAVYILKRSQSVYWSFQLESYFFFNVEKPSSNTKILMTEEKLFLQTKMFRQLSCVETKIFGLKSALVQNVWTKLLLRNQNAWTK